MTSKTDQTPDRGDVVLKTANNMDPADMYLLVLSPADFNARTGTLIGLFVSAQDVHAKNPFATSLGATGELAGLYALGNYPMTLHWSPAQVKVKGKAPEDARLDAVETLNQILEIAN
jgi:hypothetical protein